MEGWLLGKEHVKQAPHFPFSAHQSTCVHHGQGTVGPCGEVQGLLHIPPSSSGHQTLDGSPVQPAVEPNLDSSGLGKGLVLLGALEGSPLCTQTSFVQIKPDCLQAKAAPESHWVAPVTNLLETLTSAFTRAGLCGCSVFAFIPGWLVSGKCPKNKFRKNKEILILINDNHKVRLPVPSICVSRDALNYFEKTNLHLNCRSGAPVGMELKNEGSQIREAEKLEISAYPDLQGDSSLRSPVGGEAEEEQGKVKDGECLFSLSPFLCLSFPPSYFLTQLDSVNFTKTGCDQLLTASGPSLDPGSQQYAGQRSRSRVLCCGFAWLPDTSQP
ncbi:hypothetical protein MG293_013787 [Ovis ammon polii]|uniref:Uncharacterized protein n=1 Tax=Ovis ammon polii TaxID=230172 RepID=A0AAD4Y3J0_OVIAM|nr:hypothetical protein MG293_013787 [Ovis ammon polii]